MEPVGSCPRGLRTTSDAPRHRSGVPNERYFSRPSPLSEYAAGPIVLEATIERGTWRRGIARADAPDAPPQLRL